MQIPEGEYRVGTDDDYYVRTNVWSAPGCHGAACGAILHIKDGKFVDIEGDESNPITQGRLCIKCLNMTEFEYHPERIIYPMKRDPKDRGKNAWERITWDEAYDLIEENYNKVVEKTGTPNAVLTLGGTGREATMFYPVISFSDFRSANVAAPISGDSCYGPRCMMAANIFGSGYPEVDSGMFFDDKYNDPRFERPEYMIVWGSNPLVSNPAGYFGHQIIDMMKMGTKLIVVDPQITWMGSRAEHVLQLRPGTDAALAIGMLKVIVDEDIYDKEFVEKWVYGFDWLVERINQYSYEEIEKLTQVPTEQMRTVARAYATADGTGRNCSIFMGVAMEMQTDALSDIQAVLSLIAITGNVDVPGGNVLGPKASFTGAWRYEQIKWVAEKEKQSRIGNDREPIERNALSNVQSDAILPELELPDDQRTVRMIWFNSCNALVCMPAEPQRWIKACQKMDFNVVQDLFMTPTAMALCDLFLPVSTFIEHDGVVQIHYGRHTPYLGAEVKAIDYGETKSDLEVTFELGKRLNPEAWAEYETIEDFMDNQIEPTGMTFDELRHKGILSFNGWNYRKYETGELRSDGQPGFNTVTGMIELYSLQLESWGEEPLPLIEPVPFSKESNPEMAEKYPIILTTGGRKWTQFHSEWRQVKGMREIDPWPVLTVNPETAKEYGISEGDWAEVFNDTGKARLKVKVSPVIKPGMVHATHAWWFPEQDGEAPNYFGAFKSNINTLLPNDSCGRMYKGSPYKSNMCNIRRVTGLDD